MPGEFISLLDCIQPHEMSFNVECNHWTRTIIFRVEDEMTLEVFIVCQSRALQVSKSSNVWDVLSHVLLIINYKCQWRDMSIQRWQSNLEL